MKPTTELLLLLPQKAGVEETEPQWVGVCSVSGPPQPSVCLGSVRRNATSQESGRRRAETQLRGVPIGGEGRALPWGLEPRPVPTPTFLPMASHMYHTGQRRAAVVQAGPRPQRVRQLSVVPGMARVRPPGEPAVPAEPPAKARCC